MDDPPAEGEVLRSKDVGAAVASTITLPSGKVEKRVACASCCGSKPDICDMVEVAGTPLLASHAAICSYVSAIQTTSNG